MDLVNFLWSILLTYSFEIRVFFKMVTMFLYFGNGAIALIVDRIKVAIDILYKVYVKLASRRSLAGIVSR